MPYGYPKRVRDWTGAVVLAAMTVILGSTTSAVAAPAMSPSDSGARQQVAMSSPSVGSQRPDADLGMTAKQWAASQAKAERAKESAKAAPVQKWVAVPVGLNKRLDKASTTATVYSAVPYGTAITVFEQVIGDNPYGSGDKWYRVDAGGKTAFVWAGGLADTAPPPLVIQQPVRQQPVRQGSYLPPKKKQPPARANANIGGNATGGSYDWSGVAQCESGQNWSINTGNGYYGGLQFKLSTWQSVGGQGLPSNAPREEQIKRAEMLLQRGATASSQWPVCSRYLVKK